MPYKPVSCGVERPSSSMATRHKRQDHKLDQVGFFDPWR